VTVAVRGGAPAPAATAPARLATASVVRTTLVASVLTAGTLGYAPTRPLVNQLTGTYTWLPRPGARIAAGGALYRVDDVPVVLLRGRIPAWRPFVLGMTGGPDVRQLQANLIALGDAAGLLTAPTGQFDVATADAVARWQAANGYPATGAIALGQVVFLPSAVRAGAAVAAPGQAASPGQSPYQVTTARRVVTVPAGPTLPPVRTGERVTIVLPSNATAPGRVTAVGSPPPTVGGPPSHSTAPLVITVHPDRPRATGTGSGVPVQVSLPVQTARDVLAVPVTALLALAGGGYGVEVVTGSGRHRLTGVRTGLYAGGRVAISGPGIAAGTRVVVAQ
jgi:peptidoglycan hydrolase-like protein with peptidoglycan-binding domain